MFLDYDKFHKIIIGNLSFEIKEVFNLAKQ